MDPWLLLSSCSTLLLLLAHWQSEARTAALSSFGFSVAIGASAAALFPVKSASWKYYPVSKTLRLEFGHLRTLTSRGSPRMWLNQLSMCQLFTLLLFLDCLLAYFTHEVEQFKCAKYHIQHELRKTGRSTLVDHVESFSDCFISNHDQSVGNMLNLCLQAIQRLRNKGAGDYCCFLFISAFSRFSEWLSKINVAVKTHQSSVLEPLAG